MKIKYLLLSLVVLLWSCNAEPSIKLYKDSTNVSDIDAKFLIVPGKSIGRYFIGQNMLQLDSLKGKPDFSDAAMGKAWSIWYGKKKTGNKKNEIAIYSTYGDSTMSFKVVKQIRIISSRFETVDGMNNGNLLSSFTTNYEDFVKVSRYVDTQLGDTIEVYDSKANGIAVEFLRDISRAITVHEKGTMVNQTYIMLHPEWKKIGD